MKKTPDGKTNMVTPGKNEKDTSDLSIKDQENTNDHTYPYSTEADTQFDNQPEFTEPSSNKKNKNEKGKDK